MAKKDWRVGLLEWSNFDPGYSYFSLKLHVAPPPEYAQGLQFFDIFWLRCHTKPRMFERRFVQSLFGGNQKFSERAAWSRSIRFPPRYNLSSPGSNPPPAQDTFTCRYFHGSIVTHLLGMHLQHMIDLIDIFIDVGVCQKWTPALFHHCFQATSWPSLATSHPLVCCVEPPSIKHLKATLWACRKMGYPYINLANHNFPVGRFPEATGYPPKSSMLSFFLNRIFHYEHVYEII